MELLEGSGGIVASGSLRVFRLGTKPPSALRRSRRYGFGAVFGRPVERRLRDVLVGDRNAEPRAELAQLVFVHLLLLVGDVAAFARFAETVALDRLGEDHRGAPLLSTAAL